ncbi:MAG: DUF3987 domain-containing protein [Gammaproteobacteria bacterium]|nr:DUF3987 domain-containing protein [Gammaproteobacteria bacterium]
MITDRGFDAYENVEDKMVLAAQPNIDERAFYGVLKEFVNKAGSNSEASPVAISANVIAFFCAVLGRDVYQWIGDSKIHCRPFFLLSGKSGKARKGTSEALPRRVFMRVDEILQKRNNDHQCLNIHIGGLSSGEGICYAIRDAKNNDLGVADKRLLVIEAEFSNVLSNSRRETSTLSPVIRNLFDGRNLSPLTKNNQTSASDPHVVIIGHITSDELKSKISKSVEVTNGFLNRFLICYVAREKLVALPHATLPEDIDILANKIVEILGYISLKKSDSDGGVEIRMTAESERFWKKLYSRISQDSPGIVGSLLARSELYCRMLAMIFAVLDKNVSIEISHIKAAICWMKYVKDSVWHMFGNIEQQYRDAEVYELATKIFDLLRIRSMSSTEISKSLNHHKTSKEISEALSFLLNQSPARITQSKEDTKGRPKIIYAAKKAK